MSQWSPVRSYSIPSTITRCSICEICFVPLEGTALSSPDCRVVGFLFENPAGQEELLSQFLQPLRAEIGRGDDEDAALALRPMLGDHQPRLDRLAQSDLIRQ